MGKLVVTQFVTTDGVMEDPGGSEGFDRGGWAFRYERGEEGDKFKLDELTAADALLLGRVTYEGFAAAWPERTDDPTGFADKMNSMPKHVVTSTERELIWQNSHRVEGDVGEAVTRLKQEYSGDILVYGSATLMQTLIENDLVDEYRLMVFPVLLGKGKRLFGETDGPRSLQLVEARPVGEEGVSVLTYRPA